uniref:Putative secreted protein n=1 Tax=Xenopsylla cheopis TaxID=163159 RepID=A0A6M2DZS9_XENCH
MFLIVVVGVTVVEGQEIVIEMIITMVVVVVVIEADGEITIGTDAAHLLTTEGEEVDDRVHVLILHVFMPSMDETENIIKCSKFQIKQRI